MVQCSRTQRGTGGCTVVGIDDVAHSDTRHALVPSGCGSCGLRSAEFSTTSCTSSSLQAMVAKRCTRAFTLVVSHNIRYHSSSKAEDCREYCELCSYSVECIYDLNCSKISRDKPEENRFVRERILALVMKISPPVLDTPSFWSLCGCHPRCNLKMCRSYAMTGALVGSDVGIATMLLPEPPVRPPSAVVEVPSWASKASRSVIEMSMVRPLSAATLRT